MIQINVRNTKGNRMKSFLKLVTFAVTISSANLAYAGIEDACILITNNSDGPLSIHACDVRDSLCFVMLTGSPVGVTPGATKKACFRTNFVSDGISLFKSDPSGNKTPLGVFHENTTVTLD